jgi:hypothetical protein
MMIYRLHFDSSSSALLTLTTLPFSDEWGIVTASATPKKKNALPDIASHCGMHIVINRSITNHTRYCFTLFCLLFTVRLEPLLAAHEVPLRSETRLADRLIPHRQLECVCSIITAIRIIRLAAPAGT